MAQRRRALPVRSAPTFPPPAAARDGRAASVIYMTALGLSLAWAAAVIAFAWSVEGRAFFYSVWGVAALVMIAFGPGALIYAAAYLVQQGEILAAHDRRVLATLEDMVGPARAAGVRASEVLDGLRRGIADSTEAAEAASGAVAALRTALSVESDRLNGAAVASLRTAGELAGALDRQRQAYDDFLAGFDARIGEIAASLVERAGALPAPLAEADARLSEMSERLDAGTGRLRSALDESHASAQASLERLGGAAADLRTAGTELAGDLDGVCNRLAEQTTALKGLVRQVRSEREALEWGLEAVSAALTQHLGAIREEMAEIPGRLAQLSTTLRAHVEAMQAAAERPAPEPEPGRTEPRLKLTGVAEAAPEPWVVEPEAADQPAAPSDEPAPEAPPVEAAAPPAPVGESGPDPLARLAAAFADLGLAPDRALSDRQLEQAGQLIAAGEERNALELVNACATGAVRRIARRVAAEPQFRADAEAYADAFAQAHAGADRPALTKALKSDRGRVYLLLKTALLAAPLRS